MFDDFDERLLEDRLARPYLTGGKAYGGECLVCEDCARAWALSEGMTPQTYTAWGAAPYFFAGDLAAGAYASPLGVGEEFDTPPTCEDCGEFLRVALTLDGADYVRETMPRYAWQLWGVA